MLPFLMERGEEGEGGGVSPAKNGGIENCQTMRGGRKILGMT